MSEENKKIIDEFVNSKNYFVIDYYISKPYIETIQEMEQENEQLKEGLKEQYEKIRSLDISCAIKEKDLCFYEQQLDLYKSVLDEIREYIKEKEKDGTLWTVKATDGLLQILDKVEK